MVHALELRARARLQRANGAPVTSVEPVFARGWALRLVHFPPVSIAELLGACGRDARPALAQATPSEFRGHAELRGLLRHTPSLPTFGPAWLGPPGLLERAADAAGEGLVLVGGDNADDLAQRVQEWRARKGESHAGWRYYWIESVCRAGPEREFPRVRRDSSLLRLSHDPGRRVHTTFGRDVAEIIFETGESGVAVVGPRDVDELFRWVPAASGWQRIDVPTPPRRHRLLRAICVYAAPGRDEWLDEVIGRFLADPSSGAAPRERYNSSTHFAATARGEQELSAFDAAILEDFGVTMEAVRAVVLYMEALPGPELPDAERARRARRAASLARRDANLAARNPERADEQPTPDSPQKSPDRS